MGTEFILGLLPFGSHIKPLGMAADDEDKAKIKPEDLAFAFFNKPKYLQNLFRFVPWLIYTIAALGSIILMSTSTIAAEIESITNYIAEALNTMFSDSSAAKEEFIATTKEITKGKNVVIFAFTLLILVVVLLSPVTLIINWFVSEEKKNVLQKSLGFGASILILWFVFWRTPKFIFSFFSTTQGLIYFFSFLIGMFATGLVCYFATLFVMKGVAKKSLDGKLLSK